MMTTRAAQFAESRPPRKRQAPVSSRFRPRPEGNGSEQAQLIADPGRRAEQAELGPPALAVQAEPLAGEPKALGQELGIRALAAHAAAEGRVVELAVARVAHQAKHAVGALRHAGAEPLLEQLLDLERQAQQ